MKYCWKKFHQFWRKSWNLAPTKKTTDTVFTNYTYTIGPCNFKVGQVVFLDNAIEKFTLKTSA